LPLSAVAGRDVVALCGIGEPDAFAAQLERLGARVRLVAHGDHHRYAPRDVEWARRQAGAGGLVVTTAKDAVKLRPLWPADGPPCWIARLAVRPLEGGDRLADLVRGVAEAARRTDNPGAAVPLSRPS
jgi:tetraacyldisaccharide 4'-kinase